MKTTDPDDTGNIITWTAPMLKRFIKAYEKAVADNKDTLVFEGHGFLTGYAKYLIEYLKPRLTGKTDGA